MSLQSSPQLPRPGERVRWRSPEHAHALSWEHALGEGPFEVSGVVDRSGDGLPFGILLRTQLDECEINSVWLSPAE